MSSSTEFYEIEYSSDSSDEVITGMEKENLINEFTYDLVCFLEKFHMRHIPIMDKPGSIAGLLHYLMKDSDSVINDIMA